MRREVEEKLEDEQAASSCQTNSGPYLCMRTAMGKVSSRGKCMYMIFLEMDIHTKIDKCNKRVCTRMCLVCLE